MMEAFELGGWGMYPATLFGLFAIGTAMLYALKPDRARLVLYLIAAPTGIASGLLGTVVGIMTTLRHAAGMPNQSEMIAMGTFESMNCIGLGLVAFVISGLIAAIGASRAALPGRPAEAPSAQTT